LTELAEICSGAVIIEQGKILRAGTMDQILSLDMPRRTLLVRTLERAEELYKELLQTPHVEAARLVDHTVEAEVNGTEDICCDLLAQLIQRGYRVVEFRQRRVDLEQLFMNVTKGDVQ
jgi:ABC-2 type transport system ATP-binding protein